MKNARSMNVLHMALADVDRSRRQFLHRTSALATFSHCIPPRHLLSGRQPTVLLIKECW
jgi:hypothetical protein